MVGAERRAIFALGLVLLAGCPREESEEERREAAITQARVRAVVEAEAEDSLGPGEYALTAEKLDAFVRYQRRLLEVYASLSQEGERLMMKSDGGLAVARLASAALQTKAEAERAARESLGLTQRDVRMIGAMATQVASRRGLARSLRLEEGLAELEEAKARLGKARQEELEKEIEALRTQRADLIALEATRERWGDANVDLLLSREADLVENYQAMLAQFSSKQALSRPREPRDAGALPSAPAPDAGAP